MSEKSMIGCEVTVYGQKATVVNVVTVSGKMVVYLDHAVTVPTADGARDYVDVSEISNYK